MQIHFTSTICTFAWCTALRVSHHLHTSRLHNCSSFSNDVKMDKSLSFRDRQVSNAFRLPLDLTYVSHRVALCNSHVIWPIIITAHIATHSARKPAFSLSRKKINPINVEKQNTSDGHSQSTNPSDGPKHASVVIFTDRASHQINKTAFVIQRWSRGGKGSGRGENCRTG